MFLAPVSCHALLQGIFPTLAGRFFTTEPPGKPLRPFGWALIQCDLCSYKEEEIGTDRKIPVACWRTEGRPCKDSKKTSTLKPRRVVSEETSSADHGLLASGSVQFSSVAQSCPTLCDPMNRSTPGLPVHHQLPEFTQIHVHRVIDAIQPSHPLSSPSPPAPNPSQHQSLFQ